MQKNMGKELPKPANEMQFENIEGKNWLGIPTPIIVVGALVIGGLLYLKYRKK